MEDQTIFHAKKELFSSQQSSSTQNFIKLVAYRSFFSPLDKLFLK